jgi:Survival motor neuron (SMN) interacting protein 1 (SIP1)
MYFTHWFNLYLESLDNDTDNKSSICAYTPTDVHMRWVFALLTRIDIFCSADEISCLRSLARACLALISLVRRRKPRDNPPFDHHEETDNSTETKTSRTERDVAPHPLEEDPRRLSECSMWVVFCAVTSIWGQRDLWNDAEESLSLQQSSP